MNNQEFLNLVVPVIKAENKKRGYPLFSSVVIAQAILETGWGKSNIMMKANALFGIKATKSWSGKVYNSRTKECYDGVTYVTINDCFRAYNNIEESVSDYFDLITKLERYRRACIAETPLQCITEIKNGGYATSPNYVESIMNIINTYDLTKYDVEDVDNSVDNFYKIGNVYELQVNLNVRYGAGTVWKIKKYTELTEDGKKHAIKQENAVLRKGTKVTCKDIVIENNNIWLRIPSGYVCAIFEGKEYIK